MALFGKKTEGEAQTRIDCLIGPDASMTGDMVFKGGLRIDGRIEGNVRVAETQTGTLMVGEQGCVDGHVEVSHVVVSGRVNGTVLATGTVELHPTAVVTGDVRYGAIKMHAGAVIEGLLMPVASAAFVAGGGAAADKPVLATSAA